MENNKIAAIQMLSTDDVPKNLKMAEELIASAAQKGAGLVLLPENFAVFSAKKMRIWAEKESSEQYFSNFLSSMAKTYKLWVVGGTVPLLPPVEDGDTDVLADKVRTSTLVYDAFGQLAGRYDKIHLFDVQVQDNQGRYCESETIEAGTEVVVVETPFGKLGLSVCYDLRFPELYSQLLSMGAEILLVPSAFTWETGRAHWEILLRARAIENQCYVIGANQGGVHTVNRRTWGHSIIVDPWGDTLGMLDQGPSVLVREIDIHYLRKLRTNMPIQQHKAFVVTNYDNKAEEGDVNE
ncbi:MAG: carbon-nitrogen hydrolase family protein [Pseudomonadales bacterium]|nr:carbon-nitrogen hydrolase family protein [Pseudomonadales bacterium]